MKQKLDIAIFIIIIILLFASQAPATDVSQDDITPRMKELSWRILERLNWLQNEEKLCDVTIIVGDRSFRAHKLVLSAGSPYFEAMFANVNMRESVSMEPITFHDLDEEAFEMIKNYIYTGRITINDLNVIKLLKAASLLLMENIKSECCDYMKNRLNAMNCLSIEYTADKYSCADLLQSATAFKLDAFEEVVKYPEFLELTEGQLIDILSGDALDESEECVYEAVMRWIRYEDSSAGDRIVRLPVLMQHVRFSQMEPKHLERVSKDPLIRKCPRCIEYLKEAKDYIRKHQINGKREEDESSLGARFKARKKCHLFAVGGSMKLNKDPTPSVERYDPKLDKWTEVASMNSPRKYASVAVLGDILYAVGGHTGSTFLSSIECYDPRFDKWTDNIKPLEHHGNTMNVWNGVTTSNGILYIIGCCTSGSVLQSVIKYDPKVNEWIECEPLRQKKFGYAVEVLDSYIYVLGGTLNGQILNSVEVYDHTQNEWHHEPPMIIKRYLLAAAGNGGHLYVVGGIGEDGKTLKIAERYDPRSKKWSTIPSMDEPRYGHRLAVVNGLIYSVGGIENTEYLNTVEAYDLGKKVWTKRASMSHARAHFGLAAMKSDRTSSPCTDEL